MTRRPTLPALAAILAASLATMAIAQSPPAQDGVSAGRPGMPGLPRTAEEVPPWAERMFSRFDANQDGAVTEDELALLADPTVAAMGGARMRAMILRADADGDARVTAAELTTAAQRMFERMNSPGGPGSGPVGSGGAGAGEGAAMLTLPRTADAVEPWAGRIFARLDANQDGAVTGSELAFLATPEVAAVGGSRLRAMIVQSDANRDSRITAEELAAGARRMFDRMDRNGDGRLGDDELPQPPARPAPVAMPPADDPMPFPDMSDGG